MPSYKRLERIVKSWTGKLKRDHYYEYDDARMILTELGFQMKPETLAYLTSSEVVLEDFLQAVYAAEAELKKKIILNNSCIDPEFEPKVYEEEGNIAFSIRHGKKEKIFAEVRIPD